MPKRQQPRPLKFFGGMTEEHLGYITKGTDDINEAIPRLTDGAESWYQTNGRSPSASSTGDRTPSKTSKGESGWDRTQRIIRDS